ncbi:MAG TPA: FtsQ-type POTRA domain-containing protein [Chloroflexaceae bacterium]|nr:FtsQ-type POTRA domain-containing protein [Chloroflexaceae bacterium]
MDYNAPNPRQGLAARRQRRQRPAPAPGLQATPGPRRSLLGWLTSGRLVGLALCLASCAGLAYLFLDESFTVREVTVEGNSALAAEAVVELAGVRGWPIWFVPAEGAAARLRENAYVASAAVEVALPDRARISIVERRPEVRWQAGGLQYLVDGTGKVLAAADEPAEPDVLVIADSSNPQLRPNDQLDLDAIRLAQSLALRLPVELGFAPAQIGWDYGLGVYVRSAAGQTIVFGQSEDLGRKLAVLDVLLADQTAFTYLDLRPDNPFYQDVARAPDPSPPAPTP